MSYGRPKRKRPPFVVAYKAILRSPKFSMEAKYVFHLLKTYANTDGTHCFPSIEKLAADAKCSTRTITRRLAELKAGGLIFGSQQKTKGGKASTMTYLLYDDLHAKAAYTPKPRAKAGVRHVTGLACGEGAKIIPITEGKQALG